VQSQDVIVALKLALEPSWPGFARLSEAVGLSLSQVHRSLQRLADARLFLEVDKTISRHHLLRFLNSGLPYVFPVTLKEVTRGVLTAWASPVLKDSPLGTVVGDDLPPVWPDPQGRTKGRAVEPLHPSVPRVAQHDPELYALLSLVDALRVGRARERRMAEQELEKRLSHVSA
jgi:hypothetical protein